MTTTAGTQTNTGDLLNTLIELTHDVSEAFKAAIDRTDSESWLKAFHQLLEDNTSQISALKPFASRLSQNVSDGSDAKALLNYGQVRLASLIGDKPLMGALCRIQTDMVTAYASARQHKGLTPDLAGLFARHQQQAQGHLTWLETERDSNEKEVLGNKRAEDKNEVNIGRAMPHEVAQAPTAKQSTDY